MAKVGRKAKKQKYSSHYDGQIRITARIKCSMVNRLLWRLWKLIKKLDGYVGVSIDYFLEPDKVPV